MICTVSRVCTNFSVAVLVLVILLPPQVIAEDMHSIYFNYPIELCVEEDARVKGYFSDSFGFRSKGELLSVCSSADLSFSPLQVFAGGYHDVMPLRGHPIKLSPNAGHIYINEFAHSTGSRLLADRVCKRNTLLFHTLEFGSECPLEGIYDYDDADIINTVVNPFFGSRYTHTIVPSKITIGPGSVENILSHGSLDDDPLFADGIEVYELQADEMLLSGLVLENSLEASGVSVGVTYFKELIVLGDLVIKDSDIHTLDLSDLWISGDMIIETVRLEDISLRKIKVLGDVFFSNNNLDIEAIKDNLQISYLEVDGDILFRNNKSLSSEDDAFFAKYIERINIDNLRIKRVKNM